MIRTSIEQLPEELLRRARETAGALKEGALRAAHRGHAHLVGQTPVDQGQLRNSWRVVDRRAQSLSPGAVEELAEIINDAPHAGVVELGARPHPVSPEGWDAIYEWVRRHFGFTVGGSSEMRRVGGETGEDPVLSEITWGIVHKIAREGQRPTYFVRDSMPELKRLLDLEVKKAIRRAAARRRRAGDPT